MKTMMIVFGIIVALESGRFGATDKVTVLFQDGNQYTIDTYIEDTFVGDVFFCERETNGTVDPTDDEISLMEYVGWETWDEAEGKYEWNLFLNGDEIIAYSEW